MGNTRFSPNTCDPESNILNLSRTGRTDGRMHEWIDDQTGNVHQQWVIAPFVITWTRWWRFFLPGTALFYTALQFRFDKSPELIGTIALRLPIFCKKARMYIVCTNIAGKPLKRHSFNIPVNNHVRYVICMCGRQSIKLDIFGAKDNLRIWGMFVQLIFMDEMYIFYLHCFCKP